MHDTDHVVSEQEPEVTADDGETVEAVQQVLLPGDMCAAPVGRQPIKL